jgi:hypothetical protein
MGSALIACGGYSTQIIKRAPPVEELNTMMHPSLEGHRAHLRSLTRQERAAPYKRHDYLSCEWQLGLWRNEVKGGMQPHDDAETGPSPSSATALASGGSVAVPGTPSRICVEWRDRITEWKYKLVDKFSEKSTHLQLAGSEELLTLVFASLFLRPGPRIS